MTFGPYPAVVTAIHDGDTFSIDLDLGFGIHAVEFRCRIYGINAPELSTPDGLPSKVHLVGLMPVATKVSVISMGWDKYGGRFDGRITLLDGTNVGARMVADGFAVQLPNQTP